MRAEPELRPAGTSAQRQRCPQRMSHPAHIENQQNTEPLHMLWSLYRGRIFFSWINIPCCSLKPGALYLQLWRRLLTQTSAASQTMRSGLTPPKARERPGVCLRAAACGPTQDVPALSPAGTQHVPKAQSIAVTFLSHMATPSAPRPAAPPEHHPSTELRLSLCHASPHATSFPVWRTGLSGQPAPNQRHPPQPTPAAAPQTKPSPWWGRDRNRIVYVNRNSSGRERKEK